MNYLVYSNPEKATYPVCILVSAIRKAEIADAYLKTGINPDDVLVMDLHYSKDKKKNYGNQNRDSRRNKICCLRRGVAG